MSVRVLRWAFAIAIAVQAAMAWADTGAARSTYETPLTNLVHEINNLTVDPDSGDGLIQFAISPAVNPQDGHLVLGLAAESANTPALIIVVNNSRAVRVEPSEEPVSVEIELPARVLRTGTNVVTLALEHDEGSGWRVDGAHSRLRVSYTPGAQLASLGHVEAALSADIPPVNTVYIADRPGDIMLEAVIAQGIAMRMGHAPEFTDTPEDADISVGYAIEPELGAGEIRFGSADGDQIVFAGRHNQDLASVVRLFASRSVRQAGDVFTVADALTSAAIGAETTRPRPEGATLREFSLARLPFGDGRGAQTAVVITEADGAGRLAALAIMARTAVAHNTAWIYAWYGSDSDLAPEDRHTVFIGTGALADRNLVSGAPVEFRTALRAAAEQAGQRSGLRLSSAAYAQGEGNAPLSGVATVFTDPANPTRWIAGFTSPEPAGFNRASEILSRSAYWTALSGRAALWDENGVTGYDYSVNGTPSLAERYGLPNLSMQEIAFAFFLLTLLFVLRGLWRRRRIHDKSRGWR